MVFRSLSYERLTERSFDFIYVPRLDWTSRDQTQYRFKFKVSEITSRKEPLHRLTEWTEMEY